MTSFDLFERLHRLSLIPKDNPLWWPNFGTFEVVISAILTQQTQWKKVESSLSNLRHLGLTTLNALASSEQWIIAQAITPSGFYNMKAKRLIGLCHAIIDEYGTFEVFQEDVTREWLLDQQGIGMETADSILCYGCQRDVMVVDRYTAKLLGTLGLFDESELEYELLQEWFMSGVDIQFEKLKSLYEIESLNAYYAHFHGMIVEYCKIYSAKDGCCIDRLVIE
jgi:endonuclease-3 related protein